MSDYQSKRYYWLKLHKDFFQNHVVRVLEGMPNGRDYAYFWLKLMAESVSHEGCLRLNDTIPYNEDMLAAITNTNIDIVRSAVKVLQGMDVLEVWDDGTFYMKTVQDMIGSETNKAKQIRDAKKKQLEDKGENKEKSGENFSQEIRDKRLDIRDINNIYSPVSEEKTEQLAKDIYEIISYLNQKTGCRYRESNQKNQSLIKARLKEGFTVEDFKTVIDNKVDDWGHDKEMVKYLRPVTLFGTKFESYLNQKQQSKPVVQDDLSELY